MTTTTKIILTNIGSEWRTHDDAYCIRADRSHTMLGKTCHYTVCRNMIGQNGIDWNKYEPITDQRFATFAAARDYLTTHITTA